MVFLTPIFFAINEQRTFISSSCVTVTKTSQSSIFSEVRNSLSAASAFRINTFSNSSAASSHFCAFLSITLMLKSSKVFFASDLPIFPQPAIKTSLYLLSSFCSSSVTSSICFSSAMKNTSSPSFMTVSPVGIINSSSL